MTEQPETLTTTEAREYVRDHTARETAPHPTMWHRWQAWGRITPIAHGVGHARQNTYRVEDVQLLCERINCGYFRSKGQTRRQAKS